MHRESWVVFLVLVMLPDNGVAVTVVPGEMKSGTTVQVTGDRTNSKLLPADNCTSRLRQTLDAMKKQRSSSNLLTATPPRTATLDLDGYALHKPLRTAPYHMYVTGMRMRVPGKPGWYHVDRCRYDLRNSSVEAALTFRDLTVSGTVKLYEEGDVPQRGPAQPQPADACNMTLRLRHAGLGLAARSRPTPRAGAFDVETSAHFSEPDFLSIYAYGCRLPNAARTRSAGPERKQAADMTQEIEDVFVRGIRSLLGAYMERQLQQPLRDTLMTNMGYTISYG